MDDNIKKWLDFYYGTADVPPAKIADSLAGFGFDGYSRSARNKADEAQNRRVMDYAKRKGYEIKTDQYRPEGYLDSDVATKLNKELDALYDKARESAWVNRNESELLAKVASPQRGFENILDSKPSLAYGGVREDVAADGFMMLIGHGAKDFLSKQVFGKKNLKEVGSEKLVKENIATSFFPDYKALIPRKDRLTGELHVVGTKYNPQQSGFDVFLTDGEGLIGVQANKFAWLREKLPTAKIYGSILVESKMREKDGELVRDKNGDIIWDETITNKLDPGAPISFVVDGETVGVLMPMYYAKGWGKKSLEDSTFPDVIKGAIGGKSRPEPSMDDARKYHRQLGKLSGTFNARMKRLGPNATHLQKETVVGQFRTAQSKLEKRYAHLGGVKLSDDEKKELRQISETAADAGEQAIGKPKPMGKPKPELYDKNKYDYLAKEGELQDIHDARSSRSRESDERQSNADTIETDDPRISVWERDPGRLDVVGIDTPRKKGKGKKPSRKSKRASKIEIQVRGMRGKR